MAKSFTSSILEVFELSKVFRSDLILRPFKAIDDLNFSVQTGEALGYLGQNGSGKTTTIKCVLGLIRPSRGKILLKNKELRSARQLSLVGYVAENAYFYQHLSVKETLVFFARMYGLTNNQLDKRLLNLVECLELTEKLNTPIYKLSKGLCQRVSIAQALISEPELLILDEPFSGLDPIWRKKIRELFLEQKRRGCTLFVSSHILSDIEDICDRCLFIVKGKLVKELEMNSLSDGRSLEDVFVEVNSCELPNTKIGGSRI